MEKLLVTGFGNFGNVKVNPSEVLVKQLQNKYPDIQTYVFRTSYRDVDKNLLNLLEKTKPKIVVMFGYAGRSSLIRLETTAKPPKNLPLEQHKSYKSTLPIDALSKQLKTGGVGVIYSHDAGNYLCNYLFFKLGQLAPKYAIKQYGFVHLPKAKLYEESMGKAPDFLKAGSIIIEALMT